MFCIQRYLDLYVCFPIFSDVMRGFLTMALQNGAISSQEVNKIKEQIRVRGAHHKAAEEAIGSFIIDFERALTDPNEAKTHELALKLDELVIFDELMSASYFNEQ